MTTTFTKQNDSEVHGRIEATDLLQFFPVEQNVRDAELGYDRDNFCQMLAEDGQVFEPVHVAVDGTVEEFLKAKDKVEFLRHKACAGLKGFRRTTCMNYLIQKPGKFPSETKLTTMMSVIFKFNMSKVERLKYKLDHSQNKTLTDYELGMCIKQEKDSGSPRTNADLVWTHKALFLASLSNAKRQEYENRMKNRPELANPIEDLKNQKDITYDFFKGRFQRLDRTFCGPNWETLSENYRKKVYGLKGKEHGLTITVTDKDLTRGWNMNQEDFKKFWEDMKVKTLKASEKSVEANLRWNKKTYDEKSVAYQGSHYFKTILDGVFGDKDCQDKFPEIRDELTIIEAAIRANPEVFWKTMNNMAEVKISKSA